MPERNHLGLAEFGYQFAFLRRLSASFLSLVFALVGGVKSHPPDGDGLRCSMARARLSFLMSLDSIPAWDLALLAMLILLLLPLGVGSFTRDIVYLYAPEYKRFWGQFPRLLRIAWSAALIRTTSSDLT